MDAMLHAATAACNMQVSLKASIRDATDLILPDSNSSSSVVSGRITVPCWGDILAVSIGVCSFFICRTLLLPILLPEKAALLAAKKGMKVDAEAEEEEEYLHPTEDLGKESKQGMKHAEKGTRRHPGYRRDGGTKQDDLLKGSKQQDSHEKQEEKLVKPPRRADAEPATEEVEDNSQALHRHEQKDCFGCTQLHLAAHSGDATEVAELLDLGFDIHAQDNFGDTPLHLAVRGGCDETVQALLAHGARAHACNSLNRTPWSIAASLKDATMCKLLAEYA
eukprot:TRINITY_DN29220_c0_g1_i1.p1 TRINITY_DN29220_c0_g1~~TRINITY_DN29220_c0_g1_i1.p1  ORF type:complete len:278 (+),score=84.55 TRINITY_DN29220_c0_g1_i1:59-892(+)